jgi:hypothetical protein
VDFVQARVLPATKQATQVLGIYGMVSSVAIYSFQAHIVTPHQETSTDTPLQRPILPHLVAMVNLAAETVPTSDMKNGGSSPNAVGAVKAVPLSDTTNSGTSPDAVKAVEALPASDSKAVQVSDATNGRLSPDAPAAVETVDTAAVSAAVVATDGGNTDDTRGKGHKNEKLRVDRSWSSMYFTSGFRAPIDYYRAAMEALRHRK